MSTETIRFALQQRFEAPLQDFACRRIVFWQDPDAEFTDVAESLTPPGVKFLRLTGQNNFAAKKLLAHDDAGSRYLVYNPFPLPAPQDDWLLDLELTGEEYRPDKTSMLMDELGIQPTPALRQTVRLYARFFDSRDRVQKLQRLGHTYAAPLPLHVDILGVLAGCAPKDAGDVLIAVLSAGLGADNPALANIQKFGSLPAFWQLVYKYTGYQQEEDAPPARFAAHLLASALAQAMGDAPLKGLEAFVSQSGKAYCYGLVQDWLARPDDGVLYGICRAVEQELRLAPRFDKLDTEQLLSADLLPVLHDVLYRRLFAAVGEGTAQPQLLHRAVETRRTGAWQNRYAAYCQCLAAAAGLLDFRQEHAAGFHMGAAKEIWKFYTGSGYAMDTVYRHFYLAFGEALQQGDPDLEDSLKHAADFIERLYANWYLPGLTDCWTAAAGSDLTELGYVSDIARQRDFYSHYVRERLAKNTRVFVVISDALRYEVAAQLREELAGNAHANVTLESCQAVFPSITKFGMAALLPGQRLEVGDGMQVCMDGLPTRTTADRQKVLQPAAAHSIAVQYKDLLAMKRSDRRRLAAGQSVVYIYHNAIDAIGDKAPTESKVFDACQTALQELAGIVRMVVNDFQGSEVLVTADHGFLYTYSPLEESDKLGRDAFAGPLYELGRRYALTPPGTSADPLLPVGIGKRMAGIPVQGYTPRGAIRMAMPGGGENYVHGGVSLQELTVPVLIYKSVRTSSRQFVETTTAELTLLSESRKVSNLIFSLDFFQKQPVTDRVRPAAYTIYMADEEGVPVSDRQTVIADRTAPAASDRVFRVRFTLKPGSYSGKDCRLVIANGTDLPQEIPFRIDVVFADDFGFEL